MTTELVYFDDIGIGEAIRMALCLAGVDFKYTRVSYSEWPERKAQGLKDGSLPFGQLPLLRINGMNIVQSTTILRYISNKYVSKDASEYDKVRIDMYICGWDDLITRCCNEVFGSPGDLQIWMNGEMKDTLKRLEDCYLRNGTKFYMSDSPSVVDCIAVSTLETLTIENRELLKEFKGLTLLMKNMLSVECIRNCITHRFVVCKNKSKSYSR